MVIMNETNHSMGYYVQQRPWTPTKRRGPIAAEYTSPGPASISLPSTIAGCSGKHDCTKSKSPSYSFGGKHEEKLNLFTPGPGTYDVDGVSRTGKDTAPAPTISGRNKEPEPFQTPAPGSYNVDGLSRTGRETIAAPTISGRNKEPEPFLTPAPGTYNIEGLSRMGKETIAGPTISGRNKEPEPFQTPAPGAYNVDGVSRMGKETIAAPTISGRHKEPEPFQTPAPGAYNIEGLSRVGKESAPAPTISGRNKEPEPFLTPAPGSYSPEKCDTVLNTSPRYSFGLKGKDAKCNETPAPNSYNIPPILGNSVHSQSPSYSISGKQNGLWDERKGMPGPGTYSVPDTEKYKSKSPSYTLSVRTNIPSDHTKKPGPGAHSPEKTVMKHGPAYSFGIRHSPHASSSIQKTSIQYQQQSQ